MPGAVTPVGPSSHLGARLCTLYATLPHLGSEHTFTSACSRLGWNQVLANENTLSGRRRQAPFRLTTGSRQVSHVDAGVVRAPSGTPSPHPPSVTLAQVETVLPLRDKTRFEFHRTLKRAQVSPRSFRRAHRFSSGRLPGYHAGDLPQYSYGLYNP